MLDVPIAYFFIPPPGMRSQLMRDSRYEVNALPLRLIGTDDQVAAFDEAIGELAGTEDGDLAPGFVAGPAGWFRRFREWRLQRIAELDRNFEDELDPLGRLFQQMGNDILERGARRFLTSQALISGDTYPTSDPNVNDGSST